MAAEILPLRYTKNCHSFIKVDGVALEVVAEDDYIDDGNVSVFYSIFRFSPYRRERERLPRR